MISNELELVSGENLVQEFTEADSDRQLRLFMILAALSGLTIGMIKAATPLFALSLGATPGELGLIAGAQPLGMALLSIPVGLAIGYLGARRLFITGSLVGGLIYLLVPYASTPFWLFVGTIAASVFIPMRFVSIHSDYFHHLATAGPAKAGWLRGTLLGGSFVVGPLIGGYLVSAVHFVGTYWLIGLSFIVTVFVARQVLSGRAEARQRRREDSRTYGEQIRVLLSHREIIETSLIELAANASLLFYSVFIIVIAIEQFQYSKGAATALMAVQGVTYIGSLFLLGGLLEKIGKRLSYLLSFGSATLGLFLLGTASVSIQLWIGAILLGFGLGLISITNVVRLGVISAQLGRGNVAGASAIGGPIGALIGTLGGGILGQYTGSLQSIFLVLMGGLIAAALVVLSSRAQRQLRIGLYLLVLGAIRVSDALTRLLTALLVPAALLGLWYLSARNGWVSTQVLPPPELVWNTLCEMTASGEIPSNLQISLGRVLKGFALGSGVGLILGFSMGISRTFEAYVGPIFKALSSVPMLGWLPLVVVLAGIDEGLKVSIIAIGCLVPVTLNTFEGVRGIPRGYVEVARVLQFSHWQLLRKVIIPASIPSIYTGISLSLSHAWKALVAVELIASSEGIGFVMVMGRQLFQLDVVLATIIVIGLVGLVLDQVLRYSERLLLHWRRDGI
ncbi:MAG: hypothetical protein H6R26_1905 [Proteobacteria bacterium]|nr:hypothetical protein [Pseudomonadota bacterium]